MPSSNGSQRASNPQHVRLYKHPKLWASVGVLHTMLCAGIVFGWASLLPILRKEGIELSPTAFARIFTYGAIGNYMSTLLFGIVLDKRGPKTCGIIASIWFAIGLLLCSYATSERVWALTVGYGLLGFTGPAIQLPTLHLARLFPNTSAFVMSAQAAAFDGGTAVFALYSVAAQLWGLPSSVFFRVYTLVPIATLLTAIFVWPDKILPEAPMDDELMSSPYLGRSPAFVSDSMRANKNQGKKTSYVAPLKDAPLSAVLSRPPFYCLALWVSLHILKLNFVVATINDQLADVCERDTASKLVNTFGAMLPFGFVALPVVATLLDVSPIYAFQLANVVGVLYGGVLAFFPSSIALQSLVVFPSVATSRQVVYSTVFQQTGELFGFANYGILLGLINVCVSLMSLIQNPLVIWAEKVGSYFGPNVLLLIATVPLFGVVHWTVLEKEEKKQQAKPLHNEKTKPLANEKTKLLNNGASQSDRVRSLSYSLV